MKQLTATQTPATAMVVSHLLQQAAFHAAKDHLSGYPLTYGMDHLGYLTPMSHHTSLVSCDSCSTHKPVGAKHLFRSDLGACGQRCHLCGEVLEEGILPVQAYSNPLPSDEEHIDDGDRETPIYHYIQPSVRVAAATAACR